MKSRSKTMEKVALENLKNYPKKSKLYKINRALVEERAEGSLNQRVIQRFNEQRKKQKMSIAELARLSHVNKNYLVSLFSPKAFGKNNPTLETLNKIACVLNVHITLADGVDITKLEEETAELEEMAARDYQTKESLLNEIKQLIAKYEPPKERKKRKKD